MTQNPSSSSGGTIDSTRELLRFLVQGGSSLPSARERWARLLTDPSPDVRLRAEVLLLEALRSVERRPSSLRASEAPRPIAVPEPPPWREPSEPWRHCRTCFGHDFWFDRAGEIFCKTCAPPRASAHDEPWRFCRLCGGAEFWFDPTGSPNCRRCVQPAASGAAM